MPPVIEKGLVPSDDAKSAGKQGDFGLEAMAGVAASPHAAERVEPVKVVAVEERTVRQAARAPAHRVQLARALADAVVAAVELGDVDGAKVAMGMLEQLVGMMGDKMSTAHCT